MANKYILEKWIKITEKFKTKEEAIEKKTWLKENCRDDSKDYKIYEVTETTKEIK
jgi:hypothetical protein